LIPTGEQSGLLTHNAATEGVSSCERMKADRVFRIRKGGLYPPIERTVLTNNRSDGCKRFVVHADELLTAFVELESAIRAYRELT
jgi:hypothetical protein